MIFDKLLNLKNTARFVYNFGASAFLMDHQNNLLNLSVANIDSNYQGDNLTPPSVKHRLKTFVKIS